MRFLLDTNVVSDLRRPGSPARAWSRLHRDEDYVISAVTLMELAQGVLRLERRDPDQGAALRAWFERQVRAEFEGLVLPVDDAVALRAASLHVPDPMPAQDAYIAATALTHDLTVVTRNVRDFVRTGVRVLDPYDA